ncbi:protein OBERON 4 [Syzygium oleosum]|uniref:protein OBERON 4 n=1 Tax=Syzygium oleosum TaxID=219896 RepID=UPI0011D20B3D|nr:protein OBERON 4 [Syzygium oleosum]
MKRLRSSDDLDYYGGGDKGVGKDSASNRSSSSSHRSGGFYSGKPGEAAPPRKVLLASYSSRYDRDRPLDDDGGRDGLRIPRKRSDHDLERYDRRKGLGLGFGPDRHAERKGHGVDFAERDGYGGNRGFAHRSDGFCGPKKEFPKGFRSERDRSRREGSTSSSSWQRFGNGSKDVDESRSIRPGFMDDRDRKALRDAKSPTWSKDSGSEQSRRGLRDGKVREKEKDKSPSVSKGDSGSEQQSKMRSPPKNLEAREVKAKEKEKSPSWSSERSSVETKKPEELLAESGSSSEMEEGELEPEAAGEVGLAPEVGNGGSPKKSVQLESDHREVVESEGRAKVAEVVGKSLCEEEKECPEESPVEEKREHTDEAFQDHRKISNDEMSGSNGEESETESDSAIVKDREILKGEEESWGGHLESAEEAVHYRVLGKHLQDEEPPKQDKGFDLELKEEGAESQEFKLGEPEGSVLPEDKTGLAGERLVHSFKDKGKSVAFVPIEVAEVAEERLWVEREFRDVVSSRDMDMEGPSTRGFELFSSSPVRKAEKSDNPGIPRQKDDKLGMEQLDLSLSLPNVLLPIGATGDNTAAAPASPSQCRSVQSWSTFRTNSEGFTQSMSFSGSQSFFHNPSCSLTQNSVDYEQSVKSRPLFQGVDWQALAQNEAKPKEAPVYQGSLSNGNGSLYQSQAVQGNSNGELVQGLNLRVSEGSSKMLSGLDRQLSFNKQLMGGQTKRHDDVKSPSQSVGSHDLGTSYGFDKKRAAREKHGSSLYRSGSQKEHDQLLMGGSGTEFVESLIEKIVSEPLYEIARKFREMREESLTCFKESIRELMVNKDKQRQLWAFREALQNRSDITIEMLLKCHRAQLEILVALKTGLPDYLQLQSGHPSSDLAEIFLNLRCRNLSCRNALPVNECDCKVCVKKNGFCSDCMCLVCSKFDMASNTCSWVGCDVCLHWCHVDCAIRESYIRNGHSATSTQGMTEMQFHCVACDHPSEMFGFVKEVFQNFARGWNAENFYRELEYVKRIFHASKDLRGRRLCEVADQMLMRLANKANLPEVYIYIMTFLNGSDSAKYDKTLDSGIERGKGVNNVAGSSQDMSWVTAAVAEKVPFQGERVCSTIPSPNMGRSDKHALELELQRSDKKEPLFDEVESIVRIKQAEAKMFQNRADDARREADGLKRIAMAKNEKVEEEYMARIAKLRLPEAEELRRQKFEELQALERAHREYYNMKIRMEADIKDLLSKMEATQRNLAL